MMMALSWSAEALFAANLAQLYSLNTKALSLMREGLFLWLNP